MWRELLMSMRGQRAVPGLALPQPPFDAAATLHELVMPARLTLPLRQQRGLAPAPQVRVGQRVRRGEALTHQGEDGEVALHAPTSGRIVALDEVPLPHPGGLRGAAFTLEPDGRDEPLGQTPLANRWQAQAPDTLRLELAPLGIAGLGGATFPSARKLAAAGVRGGVQTLVVNAAECEPYISCDDALLRREAESVVSGCRILRHAAGADDCVIAIEDNMPLALAALRAALHGSTEAPRVAVLASRYPAGDERQLMRTLLGREVPSGGRPTDVGAICFNVATAYAVHRAVYFAEPCISRIVTITGHGVRRPANVRAPLGASVAALIDAAGGYREAARLVLGGALTGFELASDAVPVTKAVNCVIAATARDRAAHAPARPCIRCGRCAEVCPAALQPQQLYAHCAAGDREGAERAHLRDCVECGLCSYVCPSHLPLLAWFRHARDEAQRAQAAAARANHSRERHQARQRRLTAQAQARGARLARLQLGTAAGDEVRAALARVRQRRARRREQVDGDD